uniref:Uncharacterized protein n=1 Tax=Arundo donax TaxID=35708 RepID=A0A0A9FP71_ARUDO
MGQPVCSQKLS